MKAIAIIMAASLWCNTSSFAQEQKIIADCTILFSIKITGAEQKNVGSKTIYIKGKQMRVDLDNNAFKQTLFYNSTTGNVAVLKEIGASKYISQYNADEWKKLNHMYDGITVDLKDSTKNILGYNCKQVLLTLANGNIFMAYYVPGLMPSVMELPFDSKNIPGLVLEYEAANKQNEQIIYSAQKIDFKPVATHQFDIPQTGYRILH